MKKLISLLSLFVVFTANAQSQGSPMPYGPRILNTNEVTLDDFVRIPVMYDNGQIKDYILKDSLKNYILADVRDSIIKSQNYLNVVDFGAIINDGEDDLEFIQASVDSAYNGEVKNVYIPGEVNISGTLYIYENIRLFGDGGATSVIRALPDAEFDLITLVENNVIAEYVYPTMIAMKGASWNQHIPHNNVIIEGLGIDWNGVNVGANSATPILLGVTKNSVIKNNFFYDALPNDLNNTSNANHGSHILMAFAEDNLIYNNHFRSCDYENISNNYLSNNNHIINNTFYIDKPSTFRYQVHAIQTANVNATLLSSQYGDNVSKNLYVEGNTFILKNNIANGVTQHRANGLYVYNNYFKADGVTPVFVKPFDGATNFEIIGNTFEGINVNGFETFGNGEFGFMAVSASNHASGLVPVANGIISNNTVRIKNNANYTGVVPSYINPVIGSNAVNANSNVLISNNNIFIDGYDNYDKSLISVRGNGFTVEGNIASLVNPFETQTSAGFSFLKIDNSTNVLVGGNNVTGILGNDIKYLNTNTKIKLGVNNFDSVINPITPIDNAEWVNLGKRVTNPTYNRRIDFITYNSRPFLTYLYERWNGSAWTSVFGLGIGEGALEYSTVGNTVALGYQSQQYGTGGNSSSIGQNSLQRNAGAGSNGIGVNSGRWNTGVNNNFMGENTGRYNHSDNVTYIGDYINPDFVPDNTTLKSFTNSNITLSGQIFNISAHGFPAGVHNLRFNVTSGTPPNGLSDGSVYRFERIDANNLKLLYDVFTDLGSGTFSVVRGINLNNTIGLGNAIIHNKANQMILGNASLTETIIGGITAGSAPANIVTVDGSQILKYRTPAQTLTDIGAQPLNVNLTNLSGSLISGTGFIKVSSGAYSVDTNTYALDNSVVKLSGNQTIADIKTFSSSPIVPTPSTGTQAANKDYVDGAISAQSWTATFTGDVTFSVSGSQILNANLSDVPDATEWSNAGNWEITWKDSGFFYKLSSMEDVLEAVPSYGSGNLSLSLVVTSSVTIPTGAKIRFTNY